MRAEPLGAVRCPARWLRCNGDDVCSSYAKRNLGNGICAKAWLSNRNRKPRNHARTIWQTDQIYTPSPQNK
eukprot:6189792-Pleurochrysis_carterae.AAC.4